MQNWETDRLSSVVTRKTGRNIMTPKEPLNAAFPIHWLQHLAQRQWVVNRSPSLKTNPQSRHSVIGNKNSLFGGWDIAERGVGVKKNGTTGCMTGSGKWPTSYSDTARWQGWRHQQTAIHLSILHLPWHRLFGPQKRVIADG